MTNTTSSATTPRAVKRVGILTFHRALNYGAVLQAYALQQAIARLSPDLDVKIVDYRCPAIDDVYSLKRINLQRGLCFGLSRYLYRCLNFPEYYSKKNPFRMFSERHILKTKSVSKKMIGELVPDFDFFVSGSDQVWNLEMTGGDGTYFLDFAPKKKRVAYAPSFGGAKLDENNEQIYRKCLQGWECLSVREESGARLVQALLGRRPPVVLDPTFLLTANDWLKISNEPFRIRKNKYILIYKNRASKNMLRLADDLASKNGYLVRWISPGVRHAGREFFFPQSPAEFLGLFQNAEFVLTNSFHGTAFAIILRKPFLSEMIDGHGNTNLRVKNILKSLNLSACGRMDLSDSKKLLHDDFIDWNEVESRLSELREKSIDYLRDSFHE